MKKIYYLLAMCLISTFVSCTSGAEDLSEENNNTWEEMKTFYGLEEVNSAVLATETFPLITKAEMLQVLESLRKNNDIQRACTINSENKGEYKTLHISMLEEGSVNNQNSTNSSYQINITLEFDVKNGQYYYIGQDNGFTSDSFIWKSDGLSVYPDQKAPGIIRFDSDSYLYFHLSDEYNRLVKVPVVFSGSLNTKEEKGDYSFRLFKFSDR